MKSPRELWLLARPYLLVFDPTLTAVLTMITLISCVTMYSAALDFPGRFDGHVRNLLLAFVVMWIAANVNPTLLLRIAVPVYLAGLALLIAVALFGDVSKGARRWLHVGVTRIQPSEVMKIAMPLMLAWYFQRREGILYWYDFAIAAALLLIPSYLIARQPDLGTSILVFAAGAYVIFLAGLQAIPQDLYEAARIDGANRWRQFLHITLPMLGPVLMVVGVITVSGYFQLFAEPYVMTRGDPLQSTVSVLYFMFEEGFRWWNLGRASAVAFLLFLIILAATSLMMRVGRSKGLV